MLSPNVSSPSSFQRSLYAAQPGRGLRGQGARPESPPSSESAETAELSAPSARAQWAKASGQGQVLTPEQQAQLAKLQATDREVRQHEMAHLATGAGLITSGARFSYVRGPDGRSYAVGGEVGISTAQGSTPEETLARAQQIQAAAMAPGQPSAQDHRVAAEAAHMAMQARLEIARLQKVQASAEAQSSEEDFENAPAKELRRQGLHAYQRIASLAPGMAAELPQVGNKGLNLQV